MIVLGLLSINGDPIPLFIFSLWLSLISFSLYKDNVFLLKLLIPDFKIEYHRETEHLRKKQLKISIVYSIIFFTLGVIELLT